jgi:hypothetical protein
MEAPTSEEVVTYDVKFVTYSGMTIELGCGISRDEAQALVKEMNRAARQNGQPVTRIKRARNTWEHETSEDAVLIGDTDGWLVVTRSRRCRSR